MKAFLFGRASSFWGMFRIGKRRLRSDTLLFWNSIHIRDGANYHSKMSSSSSSNIMSSSFIPKDATPFPVRPPLEVLDRGGFINFGPFLDRVVGNSVTNPALMASNTFSHMICLIPPAEISLGLGRPPFGPEEDDDVGVTILEKPMRRASPTRFSKAWTGRTSPNSPTSPTKAVSDRTGTPVRLLARATATARSEPPPPLDPRCIPPATLTYTSRRWKEMPYLLCRTARMRSRRELDTPSAIRRPE
mmetsp:Transcript_38610/g.92982  ORF Transcript_38610/g.92982 Transcript_38610/m.92982 type:complete len:246 (-) Transcript_38610:291-1028(-)